MSTKEEKSLGRYTQKCPKLSDIFYINDSIRPKIFVGIKSTSNVNFMSKYNSSSATNIVLSNKTVLSSIHPSGQGFGVFYSKKNNVQRQPDHAEAEDAPPAVQVYAEWSSGGRFAGDARLLVTDRARAAVRAARGPAACEGRALLEWAGGRANVRLDARADADGLASCALEPAVALGRWSCAGRLPLYGRPDGARPGLAVALRYSGDAATVCAALDHGARLAALRYRRRVGDDGRLTVGVEVETTTAAARDRAREVRARWVHSYRPVDGVQVAGELNTDGIVIGKIIKDFSSNFTIGVCSLMNHKANSVSLGLEFITGEKITHD